MEGVVHIADYCQQFTVILSLFAYVPHWALMIRNRSSQHVSLGAWGIWTLSGILCLFYALTQYYYLGVAGALLFSTSANFACLIVTVGLITFYRVNLGEHVELAPQQTAE